MQWNSHADSQDCVTAILKKSGAKSVNVYPLKDITRDFDNKMDLYFGWAFKADGRWNFDDITQTSPPIDTQDLVSGTNRYKIATFTGKISKVIRAEVLNSAGKGLSLIPETLADLDRPSVGHETGRVSGIGTDTFQERYVNASSGVPTHYIKYGDFIYLRPNPNYAYTAGLLIYFNRSATHLASTATTTVPGLFEGHIPLVCEMTANQFKYDKKMMSLSEKVAFETYVKGIVEEYFASRDEDIPNRIIPSIESTR